MKEKRYNIIFLDEETFGTVKEFKTYFKDMITKEINTFTDDDTPYSFNDLMGLLSEYLELLEDIKKLYDEQLIKVAYNPMGKYYYKIMKEDD